MVRIHLLPPPRNHCLKPHSSLILPSHNQHSRFKTSALFCFSVPFPAFPFGCSERYQKDTKAILPAVCPVWCSPPFPGLKRPGRGIVERGCGVAAFHHVSSGRLVKARHSPRPALWQRFWHVLARLALPICRAVRIRFPARNSWTGPESAESSCRAAPPGPRYGGLA